MLWVAFQMLSKFLRCMDCGESHVPGKGCYKYGKQWKCAKCHSAQRWLRDNDPDWNNKSSQEKKELILANRNHGGRGAARTLHTCHKVRTAEKYTIQVDVT